MNGQTTPSPCATTLAVGGVWGYPFSPWSGVDFLKLRELPFTLMPMAYWGNELQWYCPPWPDGRTFTEHVVANMAHWTAGKPAKAGVVFSLAYDKSDLVAALQVAKANGISEVSWFFYGDWRNPVDNRLQTLRDVLEAAP